MLKEIEFNSTSTYTSNGLRTLSQVSMPIKSTNLVALTNQHKHEYKIALPSAINFKNPLSLEEVSSKILLAQKSPHVRIHHTLKKYSRYNHNLNFGIKSVIDIQKLANMITRIHPSTKSRTITAFINEDKDINQQQLELIYYINSWLTCVVNQMYYEYCTKNNIIPKEVISIPEHLVHEVYLSSTKSELYKNIAKTINSYIGKDGQVYHNCYAKYIQNSIEKVNDSKKSSNGKWKFSSLLNTYDGNRHVADIFPFADNEGNSKTILSSMIASRFILRWIHPEYTKNLRAKILIDNRRLPPNARAIYISPPFDHYIFSTHADIYVPAHEFTHEIVGKAMLHEATYNFLFENTKGNDMGDISEVCNYSRNGEQHRYKYGLKFLRPYAAKIYTPFERYTENNELLSETISYLLDCRIPEMRQLKKLGSSLDDIITNESFPKVMELIDESVDNHAKKRLDIMYRHFPDLALLFLSFANGELH